MRHEHLKIAFGPERLAPDQRHQVVRARRRLGQKEFLPLAFARAQRKGRRWHYEWPARHRDDLALEDRDQPGRVAGLNEKSRGEIAPAPDQTGIRINPLLERFEHSAPPLAFLNARSGEQRPRQSPPFKATRIPARRWLHRRPEAPPRG